MTDKIKEFYKALHGEHKTTFRFLPEPKNQAKQIPCTYQHYSESMVNHYQEQGYGAFHMVNISGGAKTCDDDVKAFSAVFIDIDDGSLPDSYAVAPSFILSRTDGKGHHIYWLISPTEDREIWEGTQLALIRYYNSDPSINNAARLMRVPGSKNMKPGKEGQTYTFTEAHPSKRYEITEIINAHTEKKHITKKIKTEAKKIFTNIVEDGNAHKKFIAFAMRLNGLGYTQEDAMAILREINETYANNTYAEKTLESFVDAQKYAKGKTGEEAAAEAAKALVKMQNKKKRIQEALEDWYYIISQNTFINTKSLDVERSVESFNRALAEKTGVRDASGFAFEHGLIKKCERIHYTPGGSLLQESGIDSVFPSLNIWIDDRITPEPYDYDKDVKWFIDHIDYMLAHDEKEHFLNWIAFAVQNPGKRINHVLTIIGEQGLGKTLMFDLLKQIFGESNSRAPGNDVLSERYTHWAKHTSFMLINELKQEGNANFYNFLKPFVTDPEIEIREMYHSSYRITNHLNIMAFSNEPEPLRIPEKDRRWYIVKSSAAPRDAEYYKALADNCYGKAAYIAQFLLERDVSAFNWAGHAPLTEAKKDIIRHTKSELELWLMDQIEEKEGLFEHPIVCVRDIMCTLPEDLKKSKFVSAKSIAAILRNHHGAYTISKAVRVNGEVKKYMAIDRIRDFAQADSDGTVHKLIQAYFIPEKAECPFPAEAN